MPSNQMLQVVLGLPPGYCFSTWAQVALDLSTGAFAVFPSNIGTGYNVGQAIPAVNDQDKIWHRLNPDNSLNGTFAFAFGTWARPYLIPPGPSDYRAIWVGTLPDLYSYDGGDGIDPTVTPPGPTTGSFWQQDTTFAARTLVGVGTLPVAGTILSVGDLGGLDRVSLTVQEMPPHTHTPQSEGQTGKPANRIWGSSGDGTKTGLVYPGDDGLATAATAEVPVNTTLANTGGDTSVTPVVVKPHENMPPFVAVYVIKRTTRAHITI
jgi:microcystin-dependent protein